VPGEGEKAATRRHGTIGEGGRRRRGCDEIPSPRPGQKIMEEEEEEDHDEGRSLLYIFHEILV
jgi:hypothetical protein